MLLPILSLVAILQTVAGSSCKLNGKQYTITNTISRDVSVIGGGSAGTYTAVRLKDLGKSIAVIEQIGRLGGNTQTYHDPVTGATIDYGVQVWHNFSVVTAYAARLNVSLSVASLAATGVTEHVNFKTGELDSTPPSGNLTAALGAYSAQLFQYPYLDFGFDLPYPVPEDLLLSFGDFVEKYSLDALVPFVWQFTQGIGDLLSKPTIYVMKYLGISSFTDLQTGFLTTTAHDNSLIYESAQRVLGTDVLYNSTVIDAERSTTGVRLIVKTPTGLTLIESKKLVVAIQPTLANLAPLDLSGPEKKLFGQFQWSEYFTAVIQNTGIPSNISLLNIDPKKPYTIPSPPSVYGLSQTGVPNLALITYLSTTPTANGEIAAIVLNEVKKLNLPEKTASTPEFAVADIHRPFELSVSAEAIAKGFYKDLYALQGLRSTWWTGATWHAHDSSLIWRFTEGLLANITA